RSPQGHPVLFQAGASEQGRALAAKNAEAIYAVAYDLTAAQAYYRDIKRRVRQVGRADVPIMPGLVTYVGSTHEEALAKQRALDELLPTETSLRQLALFTGREDCMAWPVDEPVQPLQPLETFKGPKGRYGTILRIIET